VSDYRLAVARALAAVEVVSSSSYTWFGARSQALPAEALEQMEAHSAREYLIHNLQAQLYTDFYCSGRPRPRIDDPHAATLPGHSEFVRALSEANTGSGAREPGWTVAREEDGALVVSRERLSVWAAAADLRASNGGSIAPGAAVSLLMPNELLRLSPGFYMALGDAEFAADGAEPIVRFYWNLRSEGAQALVAAATRRLNAEHLGFRLKVIDEPERYSRCDAGVLYTRREDYERVAPVVAAVHRALAGALKTETPAFTKQLAPGLGLAEDPGVQAGSFGMSRCRLLAEAIVECAENGSDDAARRLEAVEARFSREGIDLRTPYLNPGSGDVYELAWR
jgi:HopA1 effector protein family